MRGRFEGFVPVSPDPCGTTDLGCTPCPVRAFGLALNPQRLSLSCIGFGPLAPRRAPSAPRDDRYQRHRHPGRSRLRHRIADQPGEHKEPDQTKRRTAPSHIGMCPATYATPTSLRITHDSEHTHRADALRLRGGICLSDERVNNPFRHNALTGDYARKRIRTRGSECSLPCITFHQFLMKRVLSASRTPKQRLPDDETPPSGPSVAPLGQGPACLTS